MSDEKRISEEHIKHKGKEYVKRVTEKTGSDGVPETHTDYAPHKTGKKIISYPGQKGRGR